MIFLKRSTPGLAFCVSERTGKKISPLTTSPELIPFWRSLSNKTCDLWRPTNLILPLLFMSHVRFKIQLFFKVTCYGFPFQLKYFRLPYPGLTMQICNILPCSSRQELFERWHVLVGRERKGKWLVPTIPMLEWRLDETWGSHCPNSSCWLASCGSQQ